MSKKWKHEDTIDFWATPQHRAEAAKDAVRDWSKKFPKKEFKSRRLKSGSYRVYSRNK
jgi:hypothetical protein